jgi:hypothetical protein
MVERPPRNDEIAVALPEKQRRLLPLRQPGHPHTLLDALAPSHDTGNTIEKAIHDTGNAIEKAAQDVGHFLDSPFRAIRDFFANLINQAKRMAADFLAWAAKWAAIWNFRCHNRRCACWLTDCCVHRASNRTSHSKQTAHAVSERALKTKSRRADTKLLALFSDF